MEKVFFDELSPEDQQKLEDWFIKQNEYGGVPIIKDNYEGLMDNWLDNIFPEDLAALLDKLKSK